MIILFSILIIFCSRYRLDFLQPLWAWLRGDLVMELKMLLFLLNCWCFVMLETHCIRS